MYILRVVLFVVLVSFCGAANILGFFPTRSKSTLYAIDVLFKSLIEKGHNITLVSSFAFKESTKNYSILTYEHEGFLKSRKANWFENKDIYSTKKCVTLTYASAKNAENALKAPSVQQLLQSGLKFDLIIMWTSLNEAHFALSQYFNAPIIAFTAIATSIQVNELVHNYSPYSYIPEVRTTFNDHMTFLQRVENTYNELLTYGCLLFDYFLQEKLKESYFPGYPHVTTLIKNTALVFVNSHISINYPRPLVPEIIEIAGFHVQNKTLPRNLQKLLDSATNGAVYFSLGSNLLSTQMSVEKRNAFLQAFGRLKHTVLWKWEEDYLPNRADNVHINKWFPQQDILAHPAIKLFITHGGWLSSIEAMTFGVPIIGIPFFADQPNNVLSLQKKGAAMYLNYDDITVDSITSALHEVLNNSSYTQAAKKLSYLLRDRPVSPLNKAVYWVEHVLRYNGTASQQLIRGHVNPYQYFMFDVIVSCVVILISMIIAIIIFGFYSKVKNINNKKLE